jgi:hypothetical protein
LEQSPVIHSSVSKLYVRSLEEAPKFWLVAALVIAVTCNRWHKSQSINCCWGNKLKCNGNDTIKWFHIEGCTVMWTVWVQHVAIPIKITDKL